MTESSTPSDAPQPAPNSLEGLPHYARNLLKIEVPIVVRLADKKQKIEDILRLGPGAIIQFDKPCEQPLEMFVSGQPVAEGEAVKVGEKFGFQISAMTLPDEHFAPVMRARVAEQQPATEQPTAEQPPTAEESPTSEDGDTVES